MNLYRPRVLWYWVIRSIVQICKPPKLLTQILGCDSCSCDDSRAVHEDRNFRSIFCLKIFSRSNVQFIEKKGTAQLCLADDFLHLITEMAVGTSEQC